MGEVANRVAKTPEVREARRLFLYGDGDGRRVLNVAKLAELAGCHVDSIRRHLPTWEREAEEITANSSENGFQLRLSAETLKKHEADCMKFRSCIDAQFAELERLPVLEKQLLSIAKSLADHTPDAAETVVSLVQSFVSLHGSRKAGEAHLLKLQSHWSRMAGVESLQAVAETREKTLATGRAKQALRREEAGDAGGDGSQARRVGGPAAGGVFAKRAVVEIAPAADEVGDDEV